MTFRLRKLVNSQNPLINTILISIVTAISKVLGFIREIVIAAFFGTSFYLDAFLIASVIPNMLFSVVGGALTTTVLPLVTEYKQKEGKESVLTFLNSLTVFILIILLLLVIIGEVFAGGITHIVAPGFKGEVLQTAVKLNRIMFPVMIFLGLGGLAAGILQSQKRFLYPASTGLPYNIVIISMLLIGGKLWGITGLAVATLMGVVSQWLFQVPDLRRIGFRFKLQIDFSHPGLRKMGTLIIPVIIGTGVFQINLLVDRMLASGLGEGSISALHYASKLNYIVYGIIAVAVAKAMYPELSQAAVIQDTRKLIDLLLRSINGLLLLIIPAALGMIILREPLVRIIYERGAFDQIATGLTAFALLFYVLGLPAMSVREMLLRAFWSLQDTKTPMLIGLGIVVLNIILNLILIRYLAHGGLALATSISIIVDVLLLIWCLCKKLGQLGGKVILMSGSKITVASLIMSMGVYFLYNSLIHMLTVGTGGDLIILSTCGVSGAVVYFLLIKLMSVNEFEWLAHKFLSKLGK